MELLFPSPGQAQTGSAARENLQSLSHTFSCWDKPDKMSLKILRLKRRLTPPSPPKTDAESCGQLWTPGLTEGR